MRQTLDQIEKEVLKYCAEATSLPIDPTKLEGDKNAIRAATKNLQSMGCITNDNIMTNRGLAYLVVEAQVPFLQIYEANEGDFASMAEDIQMRRKILGSDEYFNVFQYYWFKKHIELDMFVGPHHQFKIITNPTENTKMQLDLLIQLIDDGRIPNDRLLTMFGVPAPQVTSGAGLSKESLKQMLIQYRSQI